MKYFTKIVGSLLLSSFIITTSFSKEECVTKEEVYKIINEIINDKNSSKLLKEKLEESKIKKEFLNKLKSKSFMDNYSYYGNRIFKLSETHQETYCEYMNKISIDEDLQIRKNLKLSCAEMYKNFDIDKSIENYLEVYYNYDNNNNLEILETLKELYLKKGDMEKYNHIKKILK